MVHHILKEEIREIHDRNIIMERTQKVMADMDIHVMRDLYNKYIAHNYTKGDIN